MRYSQILPRLPVLGLLAVLACTDGSVAPPASERPLTPPPVSFALVEAPTLEQLASNLYICKEVPEDVETVPDWFGIDGFRVDANGDKVDQGIGVRLEPGTCYRIFTSQPDPTYLVYELKTAGWTLDKVVKTTADGATETIVDRGAYILGQPIRDFGIPCAVDATHGCMIVFHNQPDGYTPPPLDPCPSEIGGVPLGDLTKYLFVFTDGHKDANWQGASKGFAGDVVVNGVLAKERTSGTVPYAGTIHTNDGTLGAWQSIVDKNATRAFADVNRGPLVTEMSAILSSAFAQIDALPVRSGFESRSAASLDGLDTEDGVPDVTVINVTSGFHISSQIHITGDPGDVFILRWDTDADFTNGYQGQVKFQSGGAIVPLGGLTPASFLHVAGDLNASGGGSTPPPPYPQGPRFDYGAGELVDGASDFKGGGFFTGYWLTTGNNKGETASFSNAIFVGGWYSTTIKFSMTSGTSGVHVCPPA